MMAEVITREVASSTSLNRDTSHVQGKRHFPWVNNKTSSVQVENAIRRYIPHGYGEDYELHQSRVRFLQARSKSFSPSCSSNQQNNSSSQDSTEQTCVDDISMAAQSCQQEEILKTPRYLSQRRNYFPISTPGDKNYHSVEYSLDFFKLNRPTVPPVNFGRNSSKSDLLTSDASSSRTTTRKTFAELESERLKKLDAAEVAQLDTWSPAPPLVRPAFSSPIVLNTATTRPRKQ